MALTITGTTYGCTSLSHVSYDSYDKLLQALTVVIQAKTREAISTNNETVRERRLLQVRNLTDDLRVLLIHGDK